jgi:uncharacterized membrane protein YgaE (UPF0421/DUF939 family)
MERIVIEVDDATAQKWKNVSLKRKKEIRQQLSQTLKQEIENSSKEDFIQFLNELREKAHERGLTQEILNEILKDE